MAASTGGAAPVETWSRRLQGVGAIATSLSLLVAAATGVVLLWRYRPDQLAGATEVSDAERGPVRWHELALVVAVSAAVWWTCMCALRAVAWRSTRTLVSVVAALATLLLAVGASLTWYLVEWDQLALSAVTTRADHRGLWAAGFSDDVRSVLVGGAEVEPETYSRWLLVHVLTPLAALGTAAVGWWSGRAVERARAR
jgi:quinol-cytochrome oxidoreductase complex cytochrome b subunit